MVFRHHRSVYSNKGSFDEDKKEYTSTAKRAQTTASVLCHKCSRARQPSTEMPRFGLQEQFTLPQTRESHYLEIICILRDIKC